MKSVETPSFFEISSKKCAIPHGEKAIKSISDIDFTDLRIPSSVERITCTAMTSRTIRRKYLGKHVTHLCFLFSNSFNSYLLDTDNIPSSVKKMALSVRNFKVFFTLLKKLDEIYIHIDTVGVKYVLDNIDVAILTKTKFFLHSWNNPNITIPEEIKIEYECSDTIINNEFGVDIYCVLLTPKISGVTMTNDFPQLEPGIIKDNIKKIEYKSSTKILPNTLGKITSLYIHGLVQELTADIIPKTVKELFIDYSKTPICPDVFKHGNIKKLYLRIPKRDVSCLLKYIDPSVNLYFFVPVTSNYHVDRAYCDHVSELIDYLGLEYSEYHHIKYGKKIMIYIIEGLDDIRRDNLDGEELYKKFFSPKFESDNIIEDKLGVDELDNTLIGSINSMISERIRSPKKLNDVDILKMIRKAISNTPKDNPTNTNIYIYINSNEIEPGALDAVKAVVDSTHITISNNTDDDSDDSDDYNGQLCSIQIKICPN